MAEYSGVRKVMRKGTHSCMACRKRKTKCSGIGNGGRACAECRSRSTECVAQGVVRAEEHNLNQRLQERVAHLEASLRELQQSSGNGGTKSTTQGEGLTASRSNCDESPREARYTSHTIHKSPREDQEVIDSSVAPLTCLFSNPGLGAQLGPQFGTVDDHKTNSRDGLRAYSKHEGAIEELCSHLPSEAEMIDICENHSSWWQMYRECLGCVWGDGDLPTLRSFTRQVLRERKPAMLGLLLVCFAISTGEIPRYLPPVEHRILNDDEYAGSEAGLNCLMAMGLCYMASLQPRRAWMVHRRANGLIQLNGIHVRRKTAKHDILFWELFHADRWVSLVIGLPYMMPDHLCNLTIPPLGEIGEHTWLYRKLGIVTGRVIDCLQAVEGATVSAAMQVEEELEKIKGQLTPGYLDIESIRSCADRTEKYTRLYRVVHFYQLRAFVHMPFLLRSATHERYAFSGKGCTDDARTLLEAYLEIHDSDPVMVANGTVISFNAFICAGILLLSLIGYGRSKTSEYMLPQAQLREDWNTFDRVMHVLKEGSQDRSAGLLCQICHTALQSLLDSARGVSGETIKRVVLPYFGTLSIRRQDEPVAATTALTDPIPAIPQTASNVDPASAENMDPPSDMNLGMGMEFAYDGPFLPNGNMADWMDLLQQDGMSRTDSWSPYAGGVLGDGLGGMAGTSDWSWLGADLPPNFGL